MDIFQLPILGDFLRHEWQKGNYFTQIQPDLGIVSHWNFGPPIFITTSRCSLFWPNGTFWTEVFAGYLALCHVSDFLSIHQVSTRMPRYTPRKLTVRPRKWMVGRLLSFWQGLFSGFMVGFRGCTTGKQLHFPVIEVYQITEIFCGTLAAFRLFLGFKIALYKRINTGYSGKKSSPFGCFP